MTVPSDDPPRPPTGRVPRWVADEAAGAQPRAGTPGPTDDAPPPPAPSPASPPAGTPSPTPAPVGTPAPPAPSGWSPAPARPAPEPAPGQWTTQRAQGSWVPQPARSVWTPQTPAAQGPAAHGSDDTPASPGPRTGPAASHAATTPGPWTPQTPRTSPTATAQDPTSPPPAGWDAGAATSGTPRRSLPVRLAVVAGVTVLGLVLALIVVPRVLREADAPFLDGVVAGRVPEPTAEVAALADEMFLTDEGRDLLYTARPELLDAQEFAGRCDGSADEAEGTSGAVGCYHSTSGGLQTGGRIVVYAPADPRLRGFVVETAAHELLHAAWNELSEKERDTASEALDDVVAGIDPADDIHTQITGSVGASPANRPTELFAYVGTQVWTPGGLAAELEALYGRYVADRESLVGVHTAFEAQIDTLTNDLTTAEQALASRRYEQASGTAQLDADNANLAQYRATIEEEEARLAGLSASERSRSLLSWTWRDGTPLPEAPAAQLLADARALLARDEADLAARGAALQATAAEIAAEEARVAGLRTDLEALFAQLDPP